MVGACAVQLCRIHACNGAPAIDTGDGTSHAGLPSAAVRERFTINLPHLSQGWGP